MRLDITGRHVEITPALRQLIERRLSRLGRVLNDSVLTVKVILTLEKYRHRAEVIVHARGDNMMRGLGEGNAWPLAVRLAVEKIEQQASKVKGKWTDGKRGSARRRVPRVKQAEAAARAAGEMEPRAPRVIRATRYAVKPMSIEDATLRLDEGPDAFIVFRNAESDAVGILYRRKDGNIGLIEP
jgi:putative sigma-54 modulation protein